MRSRITYSATGGRRYSIEGVEVSEEEFRRRTVVAGITPGAPPLVGSPSIWGANPLRSDALAVHPSQVAEVMERNKRHGLGHIKYDKTGRPLLTDRGMRRDLMRLEGARDNEGGYGDTNATTSPQEPLPEDATGGPICNLQDLE